MGRSQREIGTSVPRNAIGGRAATRRRLLQGAAGVIGTSLAGAQPAAAASVGAAVDALLNQLSPRDKVAQLFIFEARGTTMTASYAERLAAERPGGVLFVSPNVGALADVEPFVAAIHASNPLIPPLVAIDQEGAPVTRLPGDPAPGAVEMGHWNEDEIFAASAARANYLRSFRFDVNFAPVADVAYEPSSAMAARSFGSDPLAVANAVTAMVRGSKQTRLLSAAKHFPGHGRTTQDSHLTLPEVDLSIAEWLETDAVPFQAAVDAGISIMMVGHLRYAAWDDAPTSLSATAVDLLRRELGFGGVIVTDDLGMSALADIDPFTVIDRAMAAGIDLLLYATPPAEPADIISYLQGRVERGEIPLARIDESLRRVLSLKIRRFGLT